jgi:uncharacterized protein YndB with AHSA1/START domain
MTPTSPTHLTVTQVIDAAPAELFAVLADPGRHAELDGSGMVRGAAQPGLITAVGDVFVMDMWYEKSGDYQVANHVVEFERDRKIAWAVATMQGDVLGHRWIWELTPVASGGTEVTHIYDWSRVKEDGIVKRSVFPLISADQMAQTVNRLAPRS